MVVLICYDVSTTTKAGRARLRRVASICKDHGTRVQFSVFECPISEALWNTLRARLIETYDADEDSLRFYFLDERSQRPTEHHGVRHPLDLESTLVF